MVSNDVKKEAELRFRFSSDVATWFGELTTEDRREVLMSLEALQKGDSALLSMPVEGVDDDVRLTVVPGGRFAVVWEPDPEDDSVVNVLRVERQDGLGKVLLDAETPSSVDQTTGKKLSVPATPKVSSRNVVKALEEAGFKPAETKGDHSVLVKEEGEKSWVVVVPESRRLPRSVLSSISRQADVDLDELILSSDGR
jgi:predicted RNA binding protein YcfA (HicA-like mRNA interferase family)